MMKSNFQKNISFFQKFNDKHFTIMSLLLIVISVIAYFFPALYGGKVFYSTDILSMVARENAQNTSPLQLWDPGIFCGVPLFGNTGWYDVIGQLERYIRMFIGIGIEHEFMTYSFYLILLGFGSFFLMRHLNSEIIVALFVALATVFSVGISSLVTAGHMTKIASLSTFPIIILMLLRLRQEIKLKDFLILAIAFKISIAHWHLQIIYYIYFAVTFFLLFFFLRNLILNNRKELLNNIKLIGIVITVSVLALSMHHSRLGLIYDYSEYSTRGSKSIIDNPSIDKTDLSKENYNYSTSWSFSPAEIITFILPSFYGSGKSSYNGPVSNYNEVTVQTYFGQAPFVDVPQYMGIIVLTLALYGIFKRKRDPLVQFFFFLTIFCLLISFGKNFSLFYDLFYLYFPFFSKFRAPMTLLHLVQIIVPILAGIGLTEIIKLRKNFNSANITFFKKAMIFSIGLFAFALIFRKIIYTWFIGHAETSGFKGLQLQPLYEHMAIMFSGDVYFVFLIFSFFATLVFLFFKKYLSVTALASAIIILTLFDLCRLSLRAVNYAENSEMLAATSVPEYIEAINKQNETDPFRIINVKKDHSPGSLNNNINFHSLYNLEDLNGYLAYKPRAYQDFIDVVGLENETLWRMLNVKYIISSDTLDSENYKTVFKDDKTVVSQIINFLPRFYFTDSLTIAKPLDFMLALNNNEFNPKNVSFTSTPIDACINKPDTTAFIKIVNYEPGNIDLEVFASGTNLLFAGNTFYDKGWNASIDGVNTKIRKLNHDFCGIIVPAGKHKISFEFLPARFVTGRIIALIGNLIILILTLYLVFNYYKNKYSNSGIKHH